MLEGASAMTIYRKTNYRKIYESHYGPIPKDSDGRSYEIHHIDGNHKNNDPDNLKCVTIQEHYDIHYSQGDWGACVRIAQRINVPPNQLSELAKLHNKQRLEAGTHIFLDSEFQRSMVKRQIEAGKSALVGGKLQRELVASGKHHLLSGDIQRRSTKQRIDKGTHQCVVKVTCPHCGKEGTKLILARWHFDKCKFKG